MANNEVRFKVYNDNKFDIGVAMPNNPMGQTVRHGSFIYMTEDDIEYNIGHNSIFNEGLLRVEKEYEDVLINNGIDVENDPNFTSDEEIEKILNGTLKKMTEWLDTIHSDYTLERVYQVAVKMNLSMNKIKVLQKKMPDKSFLDD